MCRRIFTGSSTAHGVCLLQIMENHIGFGWILLIVGLFIAGIGLVWIIAPSIPWLGRLPGDVRYEGEHVRFYFPVITCLLLSLIVSGLVWLIRWLTRQ